MSIDILRTEDERIIRRTQTELLKADGYAFRSCETMASANGKS